MATVGQFIEVVSSLTLFLLHVNFQVIDVVVTQVLDGSAAEEIKAWLASATSKLRQRYFL